MGLGGIGIWQLLIILVIVILLFGTKKLRNMGGDLGGAIKNFRKSMKDGEAAASDKQSDDAETDKPQLRENKDNALEGEVTSKENTKNT